MLINITEKILLMFSLMIIILSANKIGLLQLATMPFNKLKNSKLILLTWFGFASIMTGLSTDMVIATILIPISLIYAENRGINKISMLLTVAFGVSAGSDFTYFGGGDNMVAWGLLESVINTEVTLALWFNLFLIPTLLGVLVTGFWLYRTYDEHEAKNVIMNKIVLSPLFVFKSMLILVGTALVFVKGMAYYIIGIAVLLSILCSFGKLEFMKLPFKAIYIWSGALILGNYMYYWAKANIVIDLSKNYGLGETLFITGALAGFTNFLTNTALTTIVLPFTINAKNLWIFTLAVKAIDLSFMTIFSNSCLAVASSYGLPQKTMFKVGSYVVISQAVILGIYFYLIQNSSIFIL